MERKDCAQILNSRTLVPQVGKYTLKVTSVAPYMREDGTLVNIVNLSAMTPYQLEKAKALFAEGKYQEATNTNLSASLLQGRYLPSKGEIVDVEITEIANKDGINILVVDSIIQRQAVTGSKITAFSFDEEAVDASVSTAEESLV